VKRLPGPVNRGIDILRRRLPKLRYDFPVGGIDTFEKLGCSRHALSSVGRHSAVPISI
jgi:hypothetical protein